MKSSILNEYNNTNKVKKIQKWI